MSSFYGTQYGGFRFVDPPKPGTSQEQTNPYLHTCKSDHTLAALRGYRHRKVKLSKKKTITTRSNISKAPRAEQCHVMETSPFRRTQKSIVAPVLIKRLFFSSGVAWVLRTVRRPVVSGQSHLRSDATRGLCVTHHEHHPDLRLHLTNMDSN